MPPTFDISINVYIFLLTITIAALTGFTWRSRQLAKKDRRIAELEREMMQAHAELLDTQRDYCELESQVKDINEDVTSPVITMKNNKSDEPPEKPVDRQDQIRKNRPTGTD
jgi:chromosome segregation ATPase